MTGALSAAGAVRPRRPTFDTVIGQVRPDQWTHSTPCAEWDVRALVNHVVGEDRWVPPLLAGLTIAEVGDTLAGDLLGDDPQLAWDRAAARGRGSRQRRRPTARPLLCRRGRRRWRSTSGSWPPTT